MKRKLLMLIVPLFSAIFAYSQAEITVVAPSAATGTSFRAPNGTTAHTTMRGVIIVPASELVGLPASTIITKLGLIVSTAGGPGPATGNIQYYLENTADVTNLKVADWATIIAPMTSVYNGAFTLPAAVGPTGDLTLTSAFTYTGGSLYVAFDYVGSTFVTTACVYGANSSLAGGWRGLASATTTPPASLTATSAFRPSFRFTFTNPFTNELNVSGMAGEKGIFNNTIKSTQTVTSFVTNTSQGTLTNVPVTLNVTGANPYTATETIAAIAAGATQTVLFNNVPSVSLGAQSITVSIPSDEIPANNSQTFTQQVQCDSIGYAQSPVQSGGVGFNTGAGVIGVRHDIPATIETFVKSVSNYFPIAASNANNTMKGLLLDGNGVIIDSTAEITITAGMLGTKQNFDFLNGAIDVSGSTIYVGFRQNANTVTGYFPFANQNNSYVDPNAAATFNLFGGGTSPLGSGLGYMMIDATLTFGGFDVANSSTAGTLCTNTPLTISPTAGYTNYDFFLNSILLQNGATATFTTAPLTSAANFNVTITNGSCVLNSNVQTISIVAALVNNISDNLCAGASYTFGSQTLTAGGSYTQTLTSSSGCDSTVNLTLTALQPIVGSESVSICQGDSYLFGTQTVSTAGTYTNVLQSAQGCDSTVTLTLTVNSPSASSITVVECGASYQFGGQVITTAGTYTNTLQNVNSCDSVVTLNITFDTPPTVTASNTLNTLSAGGTAGLTYQWINCANNSPVAGATSATFTPTANGSYAVIGENANGCSDTSACVDVTTIGLDELLAASVQVYPNPATSEINAVTNGTQIMSYSVLDANGRIVLVKTLNESVTELSISLDAITEGTYILELNTSEGNVYKTFVKK